MTMTSSKPYLIRAIYDWLVDNELTPYILVNAVYPGVQVPQEHVSEGRIILNISPKACRGLHIENDRIIFTARFSGVSSQIFVVPGAVLAIYAKENSLSGMTFEEELVKDAPGLTANPPATAATSKNRTKPALTLVKKD